MAQLPGVPVQNLDVKNPWPPGWDVPGPYASWGRRLTYYRHARGVVALDRKTGKVSKMGVSGAYAVRDEEVTVDLKFPMLVPGSMRQRVQEDIERKLDSLFA